MPGYRPGIKDTIGMGDTDIRGMASPGSNNTNQLNKMWGLEGWTGSMYEWMDKVSFNTTSFAAFKKNYRVGRSGTDKVDYYYNIVQQDGNERRVKAASSNQTTNVARVRFGRYCDIVVSAYAGDTVYATCYSCYQSSNNTNGRVPGRSDRSADAVAGVAYSNTNSASSYSSSSFGARLCFFGNVEEQPE